MQIVEPEGYDADADLVSALQDKTVPRELAEVVVQALRFANMRDSAGVGEAHASAIAEALTQSGGPDHAILSLVALLGGFGPSYLYFNEGAVKFDHEQLRRLMRFLEEGSLAFDLHVGLANVSGMAWLRRTEFLGFLLENEFVDVARILDRGKIRAEAGRFLPGRHPIDTGDPTRTACWFEVRGERFFDDALPLLKTEPLETLGALASGFFNGFMEWASRRVDPGAIPEHGFSSQWTAIGPAFDEWYGELERACQERDDDPLLRQMLWRYGWRSFAGRPDDLDGARRTALVRGAAEDLRRTAAWIRTASSIDVAVVGDRFHELTDACFVVGWLDGLWPLLKPLLLLLRAAPAPAVGADLRTWNEPGRPPPPEPWVWIPARLTGAVHALASREEQRDPDLEEVRTSFARFLLERLTTPRKRKREGVEDPAEPSPIWRLFSIRAASSLRVNPDGRGHHVLHHARKNDPDQRVRDEADRAYRKMRQSSGLSERESPRRALITAMWWLRQAHMNQHEQPIDDDGARRTLSKEVRYTALAEPRA